MELILKLLTGRSAGQEIKIPAKKFFIGRAEDCHLRPHSDLVSRHHCALIVSATGCTVQDFGSRNGTFVNGEQVSGQRELRHGDRLKVAHLEFEVQISSGIASQRRPKVKDLKDAAQRTAGSAPVDAEPDVTDWLSDDQPQPDTQEIGSVTKTREVPHETPNPVAMPTHDTVFLQKAATEETTATKAPDLLKKTAEEPPKKGDSHAGVRGAETAQQLFGKAAAAAIPKNTAKSSGDAAAEALKRLFNSRR